MLLLVLPLGSCSAAAERGESLPRRDEGSKGNADTASVAGRTPPAAAAPADPAAGTVDRTPDPDVGRVRVPATDVAAEFPIVRALYVNRFAAQSPKRMRQMIRIADETEINALVLDMKDEFGLNFRTSNPAWARTAGTAGAVRDLRGLLDTLRAHEILPIARLVVFKDSVTARVHPEWTIRRQDNSIWRDKQGLAWVNPYHRELWS